MKLRRFWGWYGRITELRVRHGLGLELLSHNSNAGVRHVFEDCWAVHRSCQAKEPFSGSHLYVHFFWFVFQGTGAKDAGIVSERISEAGTEDSPMKIWELDTFLTSTSEV